MPFQLGLMDLRNILDLIDTPCLLINTETGKIETGNYQFSNISGYSPDEIRNVVVGTLIMDLDLQLITDGGSMGSQLIRKFDDPLPTEIKFRYLGSTGGQILVSFGDERVQSTTSIEDLTIQLFGIIKELPKMNLSDVYENITNVLIQSNFADDSAIFAINKTQQTFLSRIGATDRTNLPLEIPTLELERIIQLDIWQPGRRVLSEIHRSGRDHRFLCVYSLPILEEGKPQGILVFGYHSEPYNEQRASSIHKIGQLISSIIELSKNHLITLNETSRTLSSLEKYLAGFENSGEGIIVIDHSNTILDFNPSFSRIFHYTPVEVKNKDLSLLFGYSGSAELLNFINDPIPQTKKQLIPMVDRKGQERFFEITYVPLVGNSNNQKMLIFHDHSEAERNKKIIDGLEKQASLGETLAEFAHDARNIINRQSTGIQLLAKKLQLPNDENRGIESLLEECDNLSDMMESVLSFSRQDAGEFEVINLGAFIQSVIYRNKFRAEKANVNVRFNNRLEWAHVLGYQRSLERVLLNLINNAIDATRQDHGTVSVTLLTEESNPDQAVVKVSDTGPGIPEKISEVLLSNQFTDKASGTGLGLLISNKIIQAHHGRLSIESFSGGTIFSIYLPLHKQGEEF